MNSCIPAWLSSLGFRLLFEWGIQVSVCGDLLNVFLQKSFSFQSLVLGYVNEFVRQQPQIICAVSANNDAVPRRQTHRCLFRCSELFVVSFAALVFESLCPAARGRFARP